MRCWGPIDNGVNATVASNQIIYPQVATFSLHPTHSLLHLSRHVAPLFKWLINTQITAATTESQPQELILQASTTQTNAKPSEPPLIIFRFRRRTPPPLATCPLNCIGRPWHGTKNPNALPCADVGSESSKEAGNSSYRWVFNGKLSNWKNEISGHQFTIEPPQPQWPCGNRNLKESDWPHLEQTSAKSSREM